MTDDKCDYREPKINQLKLMAAIAEELTKQNPNLVANPLMMNSVIKAANQIKADVEIIQCVKKDVNNAAR